MQSLVLTSLKLRIVVDLEQTNKGCHVLLTDQQTFYARPKIMAYGTSYVYCNSEVAKDLLEIEINKIFYSSF